MEQQSIVTTNTLEIQNLQYAHEQYDDFVDIHGPLLNVSEFKQDEDYHSMNSVLLFCMEKL